MVYKGTQVLGGQRSGVGFGVNYCAKNKGREQDGVY